MASDAPNQDRNAGNRGDVWKHRTSLPVTNFLLDHHDDGRPFRYFESHAGKGVYDLAASRGATLGIRAASIELGSTDPYVLAEADAVARGQYLGSWKLISNLLAARRFVGHLQLCDTDPRVLESARPNVGTQHEFVFHPGDGFAAAKTAEADLYLILIDSTAGTTQPGLATQLADKNLLVWYGIAANGKPNELVRKTGLIGLEVLLVADPP